MPQCGRPAPICGGARRETRAGFCPKGDELLQIQPFQKVGHRGKRVVIGIEEVIFPELFHRRVSTGGKALLSTL